MSWLCSALVWNGAGAKTAVGYGRFGKDDEKTADLKQRLRDEDIEAEERMRPSVRPGNARSDWLRSPRSSARSRR